MNSHKKKITEAKSQKGKKKEKKKKKIFTMQMFFIMLSVLVVCRAQTGFDAQTQEDWRELASGFAGNATLMETLQSKTAAATAALENITISENRSTVKWDMCQTYYQMCRHRFEDYIQHQPSLTGDYAWRLLEAAHGVYPRMASNTGGMGEPVRIFL